MSDTPEIPREGQQVHIYHYYGAAAPDPRVGEALTLIRQLSTQLTTQGETLMSALTDIQEAEAALKAAVSTMAVRFQEKVTALQEALDAVTDGSGNAADVQAVADALKSDVAALNAVGAGEPPPPDVPVPPTPTPDEPVPTPPPAEPPAV